jgi:hypothetical protein
VDVIALQDKPASSQAMAIHSHRARSKSLPLDGDDCDSEGIAGDHLQNGDSDLFAERRRRRLSTSYLGEHLSRSASAQEVSEELAAWLRRIEAMDLSFPLAAVAGCSGADRRGGADFLADTLGFVGAGDINANRKVRNNFRSPVPGRNILQLRKSAADAELASPKTPTPLVPKLKPRRWIACDLPNVLSQQQNHLEVNGDCFQSFVACGVEYTGGVNAVNTDSDDDENDDDDAWESFVDVPRRRVVGRWTGAGRLSPPAYVSSNAGDEDVANGSPLRRSHFRPFNFHIHRQLPIIREDESKESECSGEDERNRTESPPISVPCHHQFSFQHPPPPDTTECPFDAAPRPLSTSRPVPDSGKPSAHSDPYGGGGGGIDAAVKSKAATTPTGSLTSSVGNDDNKSSASPSESDVISAMYTGRSLLDVMHKKYCANQYVMHASPRGRPGDTPQLKGYRLATGNDRPNVTSKRAVDTRASTAAATVAAAAAAGPRNAQSKQPFNSCSSPAAKRSCSDSAEDNVGAEPPKTTPNKVVIIDGGHSEPTPSNRSSRRRQPTDDLLETSPTSVKLTSMKDTAMQIGVSQGQSRARSSLSPVSIKMNLVDRADWKSELIDDGCSLDSSLDEDYFRWSHSFCCPDCNRVSMIFNDMRQSAPFSR